jgi:hypothetical protein
MGIRWLLAVGFLTGLAGLAVADVPGDWVKNPDGTFTLIAPRPGPEGSMVPNPGTQQQELANITADMGPVFYNVFEFPVTCSECHSGVIDQSVGHLTNWGGSSMASATRDPVFRANHMIVEKTVEGVAGAGAGNMCFRCHSPNAWLSGRFDPAFGGAPDGSNIIHSILPSTDDEGIMCETCHRSIGGVIQKRADLPDNDPAWNMLTDIQDWTHSGSPYPAGPLAGDPYGDGTLQFSDGMTYGATWLGNVTPVWSDVPPADQPLLAGSPYTGQTYGIYPPGYIDPFTGMDLAGQPVVTPDGTSMITFEQIFVPPPGFDYYNMATSPEHSTFRNDFIRTPQFCGGCHEVTIPFDVPGFPIGMPEQRTYTEWKYSDFGFDAAGNPKSGHRRCQDCHMPRMFHEYTDTNSVSLNCDPTIAGWFPYAKERFGGTVFHKFGGANFGLGDLMKILYPEVDLEVIGEPTNNDPRLFPGMQSDRQTMWDRFTNNSKLMLKYNPPGSTPDEAVKVEILSGPTSTNVANVYQVQVKVTNNTGHKIPSGYPDGRRFWIKLDVRAANNTLLYQSGYYEPAAVYTQKNFDYAQSGSAQLYNDQNKTTGLNRALSNQIGSVVQPVALNSVNSATSTANQVMIYEKRTGALSGGNYIMSPSLLNPAVVFDNRIPPAGWQRADYEAAGAKFYTYTRASLGQDDTGSATAAAPAADMTRYAEGANYDIVTYTFRVPAGTTPTKARAEIHWQVHPRAFMEFLKDNDTSTLRPEGPPILYSVNYPLDPNYLSVDYTFTVAGQDITMRKTPLAFAKIAANPFAAPPKGNAKPGNLRDNWGGVAFAAWFRTGLGAPFMVTAADTGVAAPPAAPGAPTFTQPRGYTVNLSWNPVANADGYVVWTSYGKSDLTASWDRLAVLNGAANTSFTADALNVGKTYRYMIEAFNAAGSGTSGVLQLVTGGVACPMTIPVEALRVTATGNTWIRLEWIDVYDCEDGYVIERQDVNAGGVAGPFYEIARIPGDPAADAPVAFTDTKLKNNTTYNYRVAAYSGTTLSPYPFPVTGTTGK